VEDYLFSFGPNAVAVRDFRATAASSNDFPFTLLFLGLALAGVAFLRLALAGVAFLRRSYKVERPRQESRHE